MEEIMKNAIIMHVYNITRKYTIDQFDKDLINAVVCNLFLKNECATFKKN